MILISVIARSETTKQSSCFDQLKAPSLSRGWIATPGFAGLAMTTRVECDHP